MSDLQHFRINKDALYYIFDLLCFNDIKNLYICMRFDFSLIWIKEILLSLIYCNNCDYYDLFDFSYDLSLDQVGLSYDYYPIPNEFSVNLYLKNTIENKDILETNMVYKQMCELYLKNTIKEDDDNDNNDNNNNNDILEMNIVYKQICELYLKNNIKKDDNDILNMNPYALGLSMILWCS